MANTIGATDMLGALRYLWNTPLYDRLEEFAENYKQEEQMLPKDILVHLEKGDRTEEFVEPKNNASDPFDRQMMQRFIQVAQMQNDLNQAQAPRLGDTISAPSLSAGIGRMFR